MTNKSVHTNRVQRRHIFDPASMAMRHIHLFLSCFCVFYGGIPDSLSLPAVYKIASAADPTSRSLALLAEDKGGCCLLLLVRIAVWQMPCGSLRWGWGMVRSRLKAFQMSWASVMGKAWRGGAGVTYTVFRDDFAMFLWKWNGYCWKKEVL